MRNGLFAMGLHTIAAKTFALLSQVALGWLLVDEEFGLYAIALGIMSLTRAVQDSTIRELLLSDGGRRLDDRLSTVCWMSMALNGIAGVAVMLASGPLAAAYGEPGIKPLLFIMAGTLLLTPIWVIQSAFLSRSFRFNEIAAINTAALGIQYSLTIALALLGLGALSFVIPLPVAALFQLLIGRMRTGPLGLFAAPSFRAVPALLKGIRWLIAAGLAFSALKQGDYLVLGALEPVALVGVYYFSFQLAVQSSGLIGTAIHAVLLPGLASINTDPSRFGRVVTRAFRATTVGVSYVAMSLAIAIPALEAVLWRGRWSAAVAPIQVLAFGIPARALLEVARPALLARGFFASWAATAAAIAVGLISTVAAASAAGLPLVSICAAVSSFFCLATLLAIRVHAAHMRVSNVGMPTGVTVDYLAMVLPGMVVVALTPTMAGRSPLILASVIAWILYTVVVLVFVRFYPGNGGRELLSIAMPQGPRQGIAGRYLRHVGGTDHTER